MISVFLVTFSDKILEATVTDEGPIIEYWVTKNVAKNRHNIIGLGCKWSHQRQQLKASSISTIHLCIGTKCLVLKLGNINIPATCLKSFFSNPSHVFVGIEVDKVVSALDEFHGLRCNDTVFDVRTIVKRRFPFSFGDAYIINGRVGLKTLASQLLNLCPYKPKNKGSVLNNSESFESFKLSKEQVKSVCIDAFVLYTLGCNLLIKC